MVQVIKKSPPYQHKDWPAWRYGPNGEAEVFNSPGEVPEGWNEVSPKAAKAGAKPKAAAKTPVAPKAAPAAPAAPKAAPKAASKAKKAEAPAEPKKDDFDREAAIKLLNDAGFDVEADTSDEEVKEALKGLETE